jgi:DNA/RNA-binding domain of Phe-tRNA-synthetase-like protein
MTWISPEIAEEFPDLRLHELTLDARSGPSPPELRDRLRVLSDRFRGAQAVVMRQQPVPWAYRVFFRHIGLDPDVARTPVEALALVLDDALTIAVMETGVPVWALDAERVDGEVGIRPARSGEHFGEGEYASDLPAGRLLLADAVGPVGVLFGALVPGRGVTSATTRMTLLSVQVAGVPDIHVEEALWTVSDILTGEG